MKRLLGVLVILMVFGVATVVSAKEEGTSTKWSATVLGEIISDGEPYYSFGYNGWPNELYGVALNICVDEWSDEYLGYSFKCKDLMLGGRITRWLPQWNDKIKSKNSIIKFAPYFAFEINRHSAKTLFSFTKTEEVLWQEDVYLGAEIFPSLKYNACVVIEGGLGHLTNDWISFTYNLGCRYYSDLEFLKKLRR